MKEYIITILWNEPKGTSSTIACDNYSIKENALFLYGSESSDTPKLFTIIPFASVKYFNVSYKEA